MEIDKIYPLTITRDRYRGGYSKGRFLAFNLLPWQLPKEIDGDDVTCGGFWWSDDCKAYTIGKGKTIMEAVEDLKRQLEEKQE